MPENLLKFMKTIEKKVLFVGPLAPPFHGQSIAFTEAYKNIEARKRVINTNSSSRSKIALILLNARICILLLRARILFKPDVVYFTCSRSTLGSVKDVMLLGLFFTSHAKIINHLHGADFKEFYNGLRPAFKKIYFRLFSRVNLSIVLLEQMKDQFSDFPHMSVAIVPNFYSKDLEGAGKKESDNVNLLYLSNLIFSKGILTLLDAFKVISDKHKNVRLHIAGVFMDDDLMSSNELKTLFFQKLSKLPENSFRYYGGVYGAEKVQLLNSSDVFILPSFYKSEAVPLSIIEAMKCSNYIIVSDHNYLGKFISPSQGKIVPKNDHISLAQAVEEIIENPVKLRLVQETNKVFAEKHFAPESYLESLTKAITGG